MKTRGGIPQAAVMCECDHEKRQHARDSTTLEWKGECHAQVVTVKDGARTVEQCGCPGLRPRAF